MTGESDQRGSRARRAAVLGTILLLTLASSLVVAPAQAHGTQDQTLIGNPDCNTANFPGFLLTTTALRQEFVPQRGGLGAVDLCLNIPPNPNGTTANFDVNIREGTAGSPGEIKGFVKNIQPAAGTGFVHVDFGSAVSTDPGTKYVIEIPPTAVTFQWLTDCSPAASTNCGGGNITDKYPPGQMFPADPPTAGPNTDFGFRTYSAQTSDLTASVAGPKVACPGQVIGSAVTANVFNAGPALGSFKVGIYASTDTTITKTDPLVARVTINNAPANTTVPVPVPASATLPSIASGRDYLGIIADEDNVVVESNEGNNTGNAPLAVFCGHANISSLSLTTDQSTIPAGAYRVPLDSIPIEAIQFSGTGTESIGGRAFGGRAFGGRAFGGRAFGGRAFAYSFTGLGAIGGRAFLTGAPQSALEAVRLSEIPVIGGWEPHLVGTVYENTPPQEITLAQWLSLTGSDIPAGDIGWEDSPLRNLTFGGVATAHVPLNDLSVRDWCGLLGGQGYGCADYGINPATTTYLDLNLLGVKAIIPWASMPFRDMNASALASSPLWSIKLNTGDIDFVIGQTPARLWLLSDLAHPGTFVGSCGGCTTLGEAEAAGAIKDGPTFGQLVDDLADRSATLGTTTIGDYLLGALPDRTLWPDSALGLAQSPLYSGTGLHVTNHLKVTAASGSTPLVDPVLAAVPPPGFLYVSGTAKVVYPAGSSARSLADPTVANGALQFPLHEVVSPNTTAEVVYDLAPSIDLELAGSTISASWTDATGSFTHAPIANQAPVHVVDTDTQIAADANDDPGEGPYLEKGVKRLGHIASATDNDYFRIPVPQGQGCDISQGATGGTGTGCVVSVVLSLLNDDQATDLDLIIYGPDAAPSTEGFGGRAFGGRAFPLSDDTADANSTVTAPPETVQDFGGRAFGGRAFGGRAFSATRGTSDEVSQVVTEAGDEGFFIVQVLGYNGATSPHSFVLSVGVTAPPNLGPCPARSFSYAGVPGTAPSIPSDLSTIILYNQRQFGNLFGPTAAANLKSGLEAFAPTVDGIVYPVESNAAVAAAMNDYNAAPCDPATANGVVSAIQSNVISQVKDKASFKYVVIVGSDEVFPFTRIADNVPADSEQDYVDSLLAATGADVQNNALTASAASRMFLSDDGYATDTPVTGATGSPVFVPKWAVGRLVETPSQIQLALDQFVASGGKTDQPPGDSLPQTAFVTGYDFVSDGAQADVNALKGRLGEENIGTLICDSWTKDDVMSNVVGPASSSPNPCLSPNPAPAPPADVVALNGHADNYRFLPGLDPNVPHSASDLLTTADPRWANLPLSRIFFSVGCHFGANIPNSLLSAPTADQQTRSKDWADMLSSRAALLVANTGYGYGDTQTVAFSEKLMELFAQGLDGSSGGLSLRDAKRDYFLNHMGVDSAYDEKALQEAVLYGLPQFELAPPSAGGSSIQAQAAAAQVSQPLSTDPVTGLQIRSFDSGPITFTPTSTGFGTYYSVGGNTLVENRHPIIPQMSFDVTNTDTSKPGYLPIGLFMTGSTSSTVAGNDPVFARSEVDHTRQEIQSDGVWPTTPGGLSSLEDQTNLLLWPAQFTPTSAPGARTVIGDLTLRNQVTGKIYYSADDYKPPRILRVTTQVVDDTHIAVQVRTDGVGNTVKRVGAFLDDTFVELHVTGGDSNFWTATVVVPSGTTQTDVLAQAVTSAGVGYFANKGLPLRATQPPPNGSIAMTVTPTGNTTLINNWYNGDGTVTVALSQADGLPIEYSVDGGAYTPYVAPVAVSGTGTHPFFARALDPVTDTYLTAGKTILIDADAPNVVLTTPADNAHYALNSTPPAPDFGCTDAGSGLRVDSCTGPSSIDTATAGEHHFVVTATDVAGNTTTVDHTYIVDPDTTPPTINITSPTDLQHVNQGGTLTAVYTCSDTGGSGLSSCAGKQDGTTSVANGGNLNTSVYGNHTLTVVARDGQGNETSKSVTFVVDDVTKPTITITSPQNGASYAQNSSQTYTFGCSDNANGSGLASCVGTVDKGTPGAQVVTSGTAIDTSTPGSHTFTVDAADNAGNTDSKTNSYTITGVDRFDGFYSPVCNTPCYNTQTAGNSMPFKFRTFDPNGTEITNTSAFTPDSFQWQVITCTAPVPQTSPPSCKEPVQTSGSPSRATSNPAFRYDTINRQFVFTAQTSKGWANSFRQFILTLPDGTKRFAYVKFIK
jgi:hypothetical protein